MIKLEGALQGVRRLAIDSSPLIYLVEQHPDFASPVRWVVERAEKGELVLCTSALTLTEVLTLPIHLGASSIAEQYEAILIGTPYLELWVIDTEIARLAAGLRSKHHLKTPDAVQIAVALRAGCDAFLTNDRELRRVTELRILVVSDFVEDAVTP